MLYFELDCVVPFSEKEIIWRHYVLESNEQEYPKVAIFIIPHAKIKVFLGSLEKVNITPYEAEVNSVYLTGFSLPVRTWASMLWYPFVIEIPFGIA